MRVRLNYIGGIVGGVFLLLCSGCKVVIDTLDNTKNETRLQTEVNAIEVDNVDVLGDTELVGDTMIAAIEIAYIPQADSPDLRIDLSGSSAKEGGSNIVSIDLMHLDQGYQVRMVLLGLRVTETTMALTENTSVDISYIESENTVSVYKAYSGANLSAIDFITFDDKKLHIALSALLAELRAAGLEGEHLNAATMPVALVPEAFETESVYQVFVSVGGQLNYQGKQGDVVRGCFYAATDTEPMPSDAVC